MEASSPTPRRRPAAPSGCRLSGHPDADAFRDRRGQRTIHNGSEAAAVGARRTFFLETRPDWLTAVRREDARTVRYNRPVSVVLLERRDARTAPRGDSRRPR